jgi:hypothetical protein
MGVRLYVLLQTFVLCACTNITMLANSETISDNSYTTSGNGYTMSDDSEKMSNNGYKMADNSDKMSDNSYKMSDDSYNMSDNSYKMSDDSYKMSDNSDKTSSLEKNINFLGLSPLYRLYNNCVGKDASQSVEECLGTQVADLMDEMIYKKRIPLLDGIQLVRKEENFGRSISGEKQMLQEQPLEASLQRDADTRQGFLDNLVLHKLFNFFKTHRLEIGLPSSRTLRGTCMQIAIFMQLIWKSLNYLLVSCI